jgi:hypothetical protein
MSKLGKLAGLLVLGSGMCLAFAGCEGRVSYYDDYHHDYHRWNNHEVIVYRSYYDTSHRPYREYNSLSKEEQRDYWKWRHDRH